MRSGLPGASGRHVVLVEFPPAGGLFQFSLQLAEGLARQGCRVELWTGPHPELQSRQSGCVVRSVLPTWHPAAGAAVPAWLRRTRRTVRAIRYVLAWLVLILRLRGTRPDVIIWSAWRFAIDGWGVRLTRRIQPQAILGLIAHEPRPLVEQSGERGFYRTAPGLERALAGAYRSLDVVYTLGPQARQQLLESWPVTAPVVVIPHGDEGILATTTAQPVSATRPRVLLFGTLTGYKGIDDLIACWPRVRSAVPDAELVLAGTIGADLDARQLRRSVTATDGVELRDGYVPAADVADLFAAARVVVLPYRRGSQSGVAHLAYTFGRPVVATQVGDIPTVVVDGRTGLLVPAEHPDRLADALVRILTDVALASRLGDAGRKNLRAGATWDQVAGAVLDGLPHSATPDAAEPTGTRQLRVLHVLDSFSFGGAEALVAELGRRSPDGWQLQAASLAPSGQGRDALWGRLSDAGLRPFHLGVRRLADPVGFLRLVHALRRLRPDVVHAHLGYSAILVPLAARLAGIGCITTLHHDPGSVAGGAPLPPAERLKERLSVLIPARLGVLLLLSSAAYAGFAVRYGPPRGSWRLLPNGVATEAFAAAEPAPDLTGSPVPVWAVVAALRAPKGHHDLLLAWRRLLDSGRQARLLIVGDGPERAAISQTIDRLGLSEAVGLLGRRDDIPQLLAAVDGVVSASHTEALPTVLLEAGAAGLPVVSTDAGGARDVVRTPPDPSPTGWLVPPHDPERLADALAAAIDDPAEAVRRGRAARDRVRAEFSFPVWTERLDALYRSVARSSTAAASPGQPVRPADREPEHQEQQ